MLVKALLVTFVTLVCLAPTLFEYPDNCSIYYDQGSEFTAGGKKHPYSCLGGCANGGCHLEAQCANAEDQGDGL